MMPLYNWKKTRAFSLPTDQHGWIRINLAGREACGTVPTNEYDEICRSLENELRELRSEAGLRLVADVIRTADSAEPALQQRLPDLVIHWADAVFASPLRLAGSKTELEFASRKFMGQHGLEGFCIAPRGAGGNGDEIRADQMHSMFRELLR
jgi:predicted AlkP superfamily phosphohydrolase/phosphomutase